jgi:predicted ABC-type ATPase
MSSRESGEAQGPAVVVIGGPNGAGKTTCAAALLPVELGIRQFVNADTLASGLAAFAPETAAVQAGRIMLRRLGELARERQSFAFETTLASRSFAPFLRRLREDGYHLHVIYVWLRTPELAVRRVAARVSQGGHSVPEGTVRRRYARGPTNFRELYRPLADSWVLCDNSGDGPVVVARGKRETVEEVFDRELWNESSIEPAAASEPGGGVDSRRLAELVENAMKRAVKEAIAAHHRAGNPVAIWKDGQVVLWYPDGAYRPVPPGTDGG